MLNVISGLLSGAGAPPVVDTAYESIATFSLTSDTATVTFSSIPQTFKHLQLRVYGKSNGTTYPTDAIQIAFNGSTTSGDYDSHSLAGNGSAASASARTTYGDGVGLIGRSGNWGSCVIDILDYTSTTKNKTVRGLGGADANGSGAVSISSYLWHPSTIAAVTSMILDPNGNTWSSGSKIALYGIKG